MTLFTQIQESDLYVRLAAPHQLQPKPDADALAFGKNFTDHMLKVFWHRSLGGWQKPEITPLENLVMHPAAKVLHYAVEVSLWNFELSKLTWHILWFKNNHRKTWQIEPSSSSFFPLPFIFIFGWLIAQDHECAF